MLLLTVLLDCSLEYVRRHYCWIHCVTPSESSSFLGTFCSIEMRCAGYWGKKIKHLSQLWILQTTMLNCSARCADLCNSGIIPIVIRDHSLVGLSPAQRKGVWIQYCLSWAERHDWESCKSNGRESLTLSHYSFLVEETDPRCLLNICTYTHRQMLLN